MTATLTIHTPVGDAHLAHPKLALMSPADVARLTAMIQADVDRAPCLNVWHPNCSMGCAPTPQTTPARTAVSAPVVAVGEPALVVAEAVRAGTNLAAVTA